MTSSYCVLFDESGDCWALDDLGRHLQTRLRGGSLAQFVLRNLGYVLVEHGFGHHARITYVDEVVSPVALTGVVMWLYDQPDRAVIVHSSSGRSTGKLYSNRAKAAQGISDKISRLAQGRPYICEAAEIETSIFSRTWRAAVELVSTPSLDREVVRKVLNALFDGYFTIADRQAADEDFRLICVGDAVRNQFGQDVQGRSYRDMHDAEYGNWVADGIQSSFHRQRPVAQEIVAPIKWPTSNRPELCNYSRLIVSTRTMGRDVVITASHIHSQSSN